MTLTVHSSLGLRRLKVDDREVGALTGKERGLQSLPAACGGRALAARPPWSSIWPVDSISATGTASPRCPSPWSIPTRLTAVLTTTAGWQARQAVDGGAAGAPIATPCSTPTRSTRSSPCASASNAEGRRRRWPITPPMTPGLVDPRC